MAKLQRNAVDPVRNQKKRVAKDDINPDRRLPSRPRRKTLTVPKFLFASLHRSLRFLSYLLRLNPLAALPALRFALRAILYAVLLSALPHHRRRCLALQPCGPGLTSVPWFLLGFRGNGAGKKNRKFAVMKKLVSSKTLKKYKEEVLNPKKKDLEKEKLPRNVPSVSSALFFKYNTALGPPYRVIVDTNFINFSIQNKLDLEKGMMDCLYAKCTPCITDCVMAELEKLGQKYRVALRIAKDPRFERLPCTHKGTYADDCIIDRVTQHKCYIVATCDRDLKRRIRKIPGVPIMYITQHKYSIERLPEATIGGAPRI
uniref:PIN domain-containing protein n=1 Tax=Musa acuminata subsp. malaccensis TaxID=214687 RepID=A0A804J3B0_MUSAM